MNHFQIRVATFLALFALAACEDPTDRQVRKIQEYYKNLDHYKDIINDKVKIVRDISEYESIALEHNWTTQDWIDKFGEPNAIYEGLNKNTNIFLYQENSPFIKPNEDLIIGASIYFNNGSVYQISYINYSDNAE